MGNFKSEGRSRGFSRDRSEGRSRRFEGGRSRGRDRGSDDFERRDRRPLEMHDVICDKCGKECQVPFKPSGDKPVLCSDCFRNKDDSRGSSRDSSSGISSDQFKQLNSKLDKILSLLEDSEVEEDETVEEE